jgi:hypothetical protein
VSRNGNNGDGKSWATAWNELNQINWSVVKPGDTILLDGGATPCASPYNFSGTRPGVNCGMQYQTTLTVGASGTSTSPITIALATDAGHNGTAVFFGGRATPLPYCHQPASAYNYTPGLADGVVIPGRSYVTIDGGHRSGIDVYGAQQGIRFSSDSDNHITVRNTEVFDNGTASTSSNGWRTDAEGFSLRGNNLTFDRNIVHDNGQDEFQSEDVATGTMHDLTWTNDWMYARRENPLYPGEPFNDLQSVGINDCTHADGIQLYSGGAQSGLTVDHSVFGPLVNQGFYPGDSGTGTSFSNVKVTNSLFADTASHNIISDLSVANWTLDHDTIYATQGGFETPSSGGLTLTNSIKYGGYVYAPGLSSSATSGTIWYGGDPVPGAANIDPQFSGTPSGNLPGYSAIASADFTPHCSGCAGKGSPITSTSALLARIDSLDAG